jgi:hypothetical protein
MFQNWSSKIQARSGFSHQFEITDWCHLTKEQTVNYVLSSFREDIMFRAVVEEAAALASISLFLGMIAVWAQVISAM